ncbi:hypothetical protein P7C70_g3133, partial [Phenoliferia sp. Uapishka_3]
MDSASLILKEVGRTYNSLLFSAHHHVASQSTEDPTVFLETDKLFVDVQDNPLPPPSYRVLPLPELERLFRRKSDATAEQIGPAAFSTATFQAYKEQNEDRTFTYPFPDGVLFGIFDGAPASAMRFQWCTHVERPFAGHRGSIVSEDASRILPPLLADNISKSLSHLTTATKKERMDALDRVFLDAFAEYDRSLIDPVHALIKGKPWEEWEDEEIRPILWPKNGSLEVRDLVRRVGKRSSQCSVVQGTEMRKRSLSSSKGGGTTATIGYLHSDSMQLTVANLGDTQAFIGRRHPVTAGDWSSDQICQEHNTQNPLEVQRVTAEHPGEDGLFLHKRVLGILAVTRAFGDFFLKLDPVFCRRILAEAGHCPIPIPWLEEWPTTHNTPPYLSNLPDVSHHELLKGDIVVFASDGLGDASQLKQFSKEEKASLFINLPAGANTAKWENMLGHGVLGAEEEGNTAMRMVRNVLFGGDQRKMARELTLDIPPEACFIKYLQDDISVLCLEL